MHRIISYYSIFLFFITSTCIAQSPYEFNWKKETAILGTAGIAMGAGYTIHFNMDPLSTEEVLALRPANIGALESQVVNNFSKAADTHSDKFLYSSYALPALFLSHKKTRKDFGKIAFLWGETMLSVKGATNLTKRSFKRVRPFVYNDDIPLEVKTTKGAQFSFFSGHTSVTTANYWFAAKVFSDYFPDSKWKPVVWVVATTAPAITGYLRVEAGKHFPTDVVVGYLVGASLGYFIPHLHKKKLFKTPDGLSIQAGLSGFRMAYTF